MSKPAAMIVEKGVYEVVVFGTKVLYTILTLVPNWKLIL